MLKKQYTKLRKKLPSNQRSYLSKLIFSLPGKPKTKKDRIDPSLKFPGGEKGGMIISADFEMSWAFRFSKRTNDFIAMGRRERENFPAILNLLEEFKVPITWATVGHLFLKECKKGDHDWMTRIPHFDAHWRFTEGDWFAHDPYGNYKSNGEWYAPDLINQILQSKVPHEMGCHTFSHIDCSYKNCPPQVLDDELRACKEVAANLGLNLTSFVFPGGTHGNYETLSKNGINIYRKNIDFKLAYPFFDQYGMLVTPTSSTIGDNGLMWSKEYHLYRFKKFIDKAIETNTIAHFWFHPSIDSFSLENIFPDVLEYSSLQREKGKLWIGTMSEIAEHIEKKKIYQAI